MDAINTTAIFNNTTSCDDGSCMPVGKNPFVFNKWEKTLIILANAAIFCLAIPANGIVIAVISRVQNVRTPTSTFLLNLCVADILIASLYIPFITVDMYITSHWIFGDFMCRLVSFVFYLATYFSILLLTAISVERYISVCLPKRLRLTAKKAFITTVVLWLIAVCLAMPFFIVKTTKVYRQVEYCVLTWSKKSAKIYHTVALTLFYIMPIAFMGMVYYKIGRKVWSSANRTSSMKLSKKRSSHSKLRFTKIALAIILSFTISWTPRNATKTLHLFDKNFPYSYEFAHIVYPIIYWVAFSNCAVNPLIYCYMSQNFRKAFKIFRNRRTRSYLVESMSVMSRSSSKRFSRRIQKPADETFPQEMNGVPNEQEDLHTNSEVRDGSQVSKHEMRNKKDLYLIVSAL